MRPMVTGVGAVVLGLLGGCSGNDPGPGSPVGQQSAGSGGNGGEAGTLDLGLEGGKGGGGAGGLGGAGGNSGTTSGGTAGAAAGGTGAAGSSSGGGASGGSKATGMCHRVTGSDPDCADFYSEEGYSQAHACDDIGAASQLTQMHGGKCASVSFVAGAKYGECCAP